MPKEKFTLQKFNPDKEVDSYRGTITIRESTRDELSQLCKISGLTYDMMILKMLEFCKSNLELED